MVLPSGCRSAAGGSGRSWGRRPARADSTPSPRPVSTWRVGAHQATVPQGTGSPHGDGRVGLAARALQQRGAQPRVGARGRGDRPGRGRAGTARPPRPPRPPPRARRRRAPRSPAAGGGWARRARPTARRGGERRAGRGVAVLDESRRALGVAGLQRGDDRRVRALAAHERLRAKTNRSMRFSRGQQQVETDLQVRVARGVEQHLVEGVVGGDRVLDAGVGQRSGVARRRLHGGGRSPRGPARGRRAASPRPAAGPSWRTPRGRSGGRTGRVRRAWAALERYPRAMGRSLPSRDARRPRPGPRHRAGRRLRRGRRSTARARRSCVIAPATG